MALAYRNTLRYEIARAATIGEAVAGTQGRLPWITTPDELTVWSVCFGMSTAIDALVTVLRIRRFRRGETIFHQGDPGDALYVVDVQKQLLMAVIKNLDFGPATLAYGTGAVWVVCVAGTNGVGVIERAGPGVYGLTAGQRVLLSPHITVSIDTH